MMPRMLARRTISALAAVLAAGAPALLAGCGREIGDSCLVSTDCGSDG
jgi:hypothetical protein